VSQWLHRQMAVLHGCERRPAFEVKAGLKDAGYSALAAVSRDHRLLHPGGKCVSTSYRASLHNAMVRQGRGFGRAF
jgi:hypothetical protein